MKLYIFTFLIFLMSCSQVDSEPQEETIPEEVQIPIEEELLASETENEDKCYLFEDFIDVQEYRWGIINDGVMGGKSQGSASIIDNTLVFSWKIVTQWGGFSSLRWSLESGVLSDYSLVKFRAKSDGREYRVTFRDSRWGNISHRAIIPFQNPWEFEEVTIPFTDLEPAYFGRTVKADPFDKESAREIGIILSDGVDGGFELVIDEVRFCR